MVGLYDKDWNFIQAFDNDEDAFSFAITHGISAFKIQEF